MNPSISPDHRARSAQIAADVDRFLAAGGEIDYCTGERPLSTVTEYNGRAHSKGRSSAGGKGGGKSNAVRNAAIDGYMTASEFIRTKDNPDSILPWHRKTIDRKMEKGEFPRPERMAGQIRLWKRETIEAIARGLNATTKKEVPK